GVLSFRPADGVLCSATTRETLTVTEAAILRVLCEKYGQVLKHEALFRGVWNEASTIGFRGRVDNQISSLRKKSRNLGEPALIVTERGRGFRLGLAPVSGEADLANEPSLGEYLSTSEMIKRFTLEGGLARRSRIIIESPWPVELEWNPDVIG